MRLISHRTNSGSGKDGEGKTWKQDKSRFGRRNVAKTDAGFCVVDGILSHCRLGRHLLFVLPKFLMTECIATSSNSRSGCGPAPFFIRDFNSNSLFSCHFINASNVRSSLTGILHPIFTCKTKNFRFSPSPPPETIMMTAGKGHSIFFLNNR